MSDIHNVAVLGGGVIGASWTALFLAAGRKVTVYDPAPDTEQTVRAYIARAWSALEELGLADRATPDALAFVGTAAQAVKDADFVQENVPERLPIKHATYAEIEPVLPADAIVSSSTSGLTLEALQEQAARIAKNENTPVPASASLLVLIGLARVRRQQGGAGASHGPAL